MKKLLIVVIALVACTKHIPVNHTLFSGSTSSKKVVGKLAQVFNSLNQGAFIEVNGSGSENAIKSFLKGEVNQLNASRRIDAFEIAQAREHGVTNIKEIIIGVDAIGIIVNPRLGVHQLTLFELGQILSGEITNWKEVGGPSLKIRLYTRNNDSGTHHFMKGKFIKTSFRPDRVIKQNAKQIVEAIKQDMHGIGYVDLGSITENGHIPIEGIWAVNLSIDGQEAVSPFESKASRDGVYPLTRPIYQYFQGDIRQEVTKFIQFELSDQGQEIVKSEGFLPLNDMHIHFNQKNGFQ
jgi:phosphate transport system substrate-binding protein